MKLIKTLLAAALLLGSVSVADAQYYNPYGPGPVPSCSLSGCTFTGGQQIQGGGNIQIPTTNAFLWGNGTYLVSGAAATIQYGQADIAGAPVAQTETYQSAAGVSNQAGANTTIDLSAGTGTGIGGNLVINGAPHATSNTTKNAYSAALTINGDTLQTITNIGGTAAAPALAILNANTGLYSTSTGTNLGLSVGGTDIMDYAITTAGDISTNKALVLVGGSLLAGNGSGAQIANGATSGTVPVLIPNRSDATTGIGAASTAELNLIIGGATKMDFAATTAATWTLNAPTTISNATFKVVSLGVATAVDTVCYASSTGLFTEEPTGTTCTVSARRFKQDINYLSDGRMLSEVLGMKPVSFRFKKGVGQDDGAEVHYGLIAEDVAKVAPELVAYEKDGQTHGVKYGDGELTSHLIGAIKAQQDEINQLKKQTASLSSEFCFGSLCVGWK